jgi:hypothetical protein
VQGIVIESSHPNHTFARSIPDRELPGKRGSRQLNLLEQGGPTVRAQEMVTQTPEAIFSHLEWRATEGKDDAKFLEECAGRFETVREPFLHNARIYSERGNNIRANVSFLRGAPFPNDSALMLDSGHVENRR